MKAKELQKSKFSSCLVNWEIFRSKIEANIQKIPIFFENSEKLTQNWIVQLTMKIQKF